MQTAGIDCNNIERLQVKWVFGLPDTEMPHVYMGQQAGNAFMVFELEGEMDDGK